MLILVFVIGELVSTLAVLDSSVLLGLCLAVYAIVGYYNRHFHSAIGLHR